MANKSPLRIFVHYSRVILQREMHVHVANLYQATLPKPHVHIATPESTPDLYTDLLCVFLHQELGVSFGIDLINHARPVKAFHNASAGRTFSCAIIVINQYVSDLMHLTQLMSGQDSILI